MKLKYKQLLRQLLFLSATIGLALVAYVPTANATSDTPCQSLCLAHESSVTRGASDINAGYRFTANTNGQITQLWLQTSDTISHLVELYNMSGTVLASANITGGGIFTWVSANITPVTLTSGTSYVVAVRIGSGQYMKYILNSSMPYTTSDGYVTINDSRYISASNALPTTVDTANMWGLADVTFTPTVSPTISSFSASPTTVTSGGPSTLSWNTSNATNISITPGSFSSSSASGSTTVNPTSTTTYTLTASNSAGNVTAQITVTVSLPVISSFAASPTVITSGNSSVLSWTTTGATSLSINYGVGSVTGLTSKTVSPAMTTTYTLTATNSSGSVTANATVNVNVPGGNYSIAFNPGSSSVNQGQTATYSISLTPSGGFTDTVALTVTNCPSNTTCSISPSNVTTSGSIVYATMTLVTTLSTPPLTYPITVHSVPQINTTEVYNTSATLNVNEPTPPPPTNVNASCSASTVTVTWTDPGGYSNAYVNADAGINNWNTPATFQSGKTSLTSYSFSGSYNQPFHYWVEATSADGSVVSSPVDGNITCQTGPSISLSTNSAVFTFQNLGASGPSPASITFTISNSGQTGTTLLWKASTSNSNCQINTASGSVAQGQAGNEVIITPGAVVSTPGAYTCTITVADNGSSPPAVGGSQTVAVTANMLPDPPTFVPPIYGYNANIGNINPARVFFSWTEPNPSNWNITYNIYRNTTGVLPVSGGPAEIASNVSGTSEITGSYSDFSPVAGAVNYYWIEAVSNGETSSSMGGSSSNNPYVYNNIYWGPISVSPDTLIFTAPYGEAPPAGLPGAQEISVANTTASSESVFTEVPPNQSSFTYCSKLQSTPPNNPYSYPANGFSQYFGYADVQAANSALVTDGINSGCYLTFNTVPTTTPVNVQVIYITNGTCYGPNCNTTTNVPVAATSATCSSPDINVSWTPVVGSSGQPTQGYTIWRSANGGSYSNIAYVSGVDTVNYIDTGTSYGNSYSYEIQPVYNYGVSGEVDYPYEPASNTVSDNICAGDPSSVITSASCSPSGINLQWQPGANAGGYNIFRNTSNSSSTAVEIDSNFAPTGGNSGTQSYLDTAVTTGVNYYYWVSTSNGDGTKVGASSDGSGGQGSTCSPPTEPVGGPACNTANQGTCPGGPIPCGDVQLVWTSESNNETGFYLYQDNNPVPIENYPSAAGVGQQLYYNYHPFDNNDHVYWVAAYNSSLTSAKSQITNDVASNSCTPNMGDADTDITAINSLPINYSSGGGFASPQACNYMTDTLPSGTVLNAGNRLTFDVNFCSDQAYATTTNITVQDSLINLKSPDPGAGLSAWNAKFCNNANGCSPIPTADITISGMAPDQILTFNLTDPSFRVPAGHLDYHLLFDAALGVPSGFTSPTSRFQNSFETTSNAPTVFGNTPLLLFFNGNAVPQLNELP